MTGAEPGPRAARGQLRPVPEPGREPPHNLEAEEAVLGAVLAAGRLLAEVAALVEEADFYRPAHRAVWLAVLRLSDRGQPTDPVTVLGELDHSRELADVGGGPFLHTLVQAVPTVANAGHYARLVADAARRRRVIDLGIRLAHSDADPAVLAQLAGELADTTTARLGEQGWAPPIPFGIGGELPAFPVQVLPGWLAEYVAAVATATQTPPDLAGMLALAVLATVAAGAIEAEPRPGWREPLCLFVAVGMDAGARKSGVFTALTRPVADYERDQAAAGLPGITETAVLRRIADQAAAVAEAAASRAPASQQEEARAEAIARAAEAASLVVPPPVPRWLVDDATPEALAGLLATYGRIALLSPEGDVFDQMAGRYNQQAGPNLGVYLKGHAGDLLKVDRRGRPPEYVERPCLTIGLAVQPEVLRGLASRPGFRGSGAAGPVPVQPPREPGRPPPGRRPTRPAGGGQPLHPGTASPGCHPDHPSRSRRGRESGGAHLRPGGGRAAAGLGARPGAAAGRRHRRPGPPGWLGGQARRRHLPPRRPAAPGGNLRDGWARPIDADTFAGAARLAGYLVDHARAAFDLMGADPRVDDARWLLDWISRTGQVQFSRRDAHQAARVRFRKAIDLEPAIALLEEHGWLRRVDPEPSRDPHGRGRPASPRFLVNPLHPSSETTETTKTPARAVSVDSVVFEARGWSPQ
jgi:replicative DNA helicase